MRRRDTTNTNWAQVKRIYWWWIYYYRSKASKIQHVFFTRMSWRHLSGLLGIGLTVKTAGVKQLFVHGPPSIVRTMLSLLSFTNIFFAYFSFYLDTIDEINSAFCWCLNVRNWLVPLTPFQSCLLFFITFFKLYLVQSNILQTPLIDDDFRIIAFELNVEEIEPRSFSLFINSCCTYYMCLTYLIFDLL